MRKAIAKKQGGDRAPQSGHRTAPGSTKSPESVFDSPPTGTTTRSTITAKRPPEPKERYHVYLSTTVLGNVDKKAQELGINRSACLQMLINVGLSNLITNPSAAIPGVQ